jgi:hypothetical protein
MAISTNFTYSGKLQTRTQDVTKCQSEDWCQKVEPCMRLDQFHRQLEHALLVIKVIGIEDLMHKGLNPIQQLCFVRIESCFDYNKVF